MALKEKYSSPRLNLDEYQEQVVATRRTDNSEDWRLVYPDYIQSELLELISQHGPGLARLMPRVFDESIDRVMVVDKYTELEPGLVEEMGDLLWLATSVASYSGLSLRDLCRQALNPDGTGGTIESFEDLDKIILENPGRVRVLNEFGIHFTDADDEDRYETVAEDPFYLLLRSCRRFVRSINQGKEDVSPSSYIHEPIAELPESISGLVDVLGYVSNARLGMSLGEIARINIEKLHARAAQPNT